MKIGIIGLGLIGGSILKRLSKSGNELYVVTRNKKTLETVKNITVKASDQYSVLQNCEVVFVCTPINKVLETLDKLENIVSENCIVTDVASVKGFLTKKKRPYKFIPSHPMAGTENNGYDFSFPELFEGAKWVITPYDYNETDILIKLIKEMGANPIITDADEHDKAVALISHLPVYIAQSLFSIAKDNELAMQLASSGFRDTTRVASGNITLAMDMRQFNKKNIEVAAQEFQKVFDTLKNNYTEEILEPIQKQRKELYSKDGKNIYNKK